MLSTCAVAITLTARVLAVPAQAQQPLVVPAKVSPPPTEVDLSAGWVDPRILGGRMLDVRPIPQPRTPVSNKYILHSGPAANWANR